MAGMAIGVTMVVFALLFTSLLDSATAFEVEDGEPCRTPGLARGTCVLIKNCPPLLSALQSKLVPQATIEYLKKSQCGFMGQDPLVCCRMSNSQPSQRQTSPPIVENEVTEDIKEHPNLKLLRLDICGSFSEDRIINGEEASLMEFPWMALLAYTDKSATDFGCGGTVINERYVLTAAHCVTGFKNNIRIGSVRLGEHDLESPIDCQVDEKSKDLTKICAPSPQDIPIEEIVPHPRYVSKPSYLHDIALVRLSRPANFTHTVRPICLPIDLSQQTADLVGKKVIVSGWGVTEYGPVQPTDKLSDVLLKVSILVETNEVCSLALRTASHSPVSQICAGGVASGGHSCRGDSGGPLTYFGQIQRSIRTIQHGIVSYGHRSCEKPGVYTRIGHYMKWVLDTMKP